MLIAPHIELPDAALQEHLAVIGKTGSGKTYTAKGLVEKLLDAGRRVCVLDPTGAWWGMRASADGLEAGYPVVVFGGDHADVPITEHAGAALAVLVATGNVPSVIDLSGTRLGERRRFMTDFAEELFRLNKLPLHLIIDEADEFAPQSGAPGTERMLGAVDRIVRRGRLKGFRVMLISQRPAVLNKNVLTQAGTLIAMRLPAVQDRKAVEGWITGQADEAQGEEVLGSLAGLKMGEGWLWCPGHELLERITFPKITTFDSGRTPDDGEPVPVPKQLAEVDLSGIRAAMAAAIDEAEGSDVERLKTRVKDLQAQLREAQESPQAQEPADLDARLEAAHAQGVQARAEQLAGVAGGMDTTLDRLRGVFDELEGHRKNIRDLGGPLAMETLNGHASDHHQHRRLDRSKDDPARGQRHHDASHAGDQPGGDPEGSPGGARLHDSGAGGGTGQQAADDRHRSAGGRAGGGSIGAPGASAGTTGAAQARGGSSPHRRILEALDWWRAVGITSPTRFQVGFVAGYTATSGTFRTYLSELRSVDGIEYPAPDTISLTAKGARSAPAPSKAPTLRDLHDRVRARLNGPQCRILDILLDPSRRAKGAGGEMARTMVAELAGYEASSGTWRTYLSELKSLGLIRYPKKTTVQASPLLFPEGLR